MSDKNLDVQPGGGFLVEPVGSAKIGTPELFTDEERMFGETSKDFVDKDVLPKLEEIESKNFDVTVGLMKQAGELGMLSIDVPEAYEGLGYSKAASMHVAECIAHAGSLSVAIMAHVGIGSLPIVFFGSEDQKKTYLPSLASGEKLGAYALTETGSGSDALAAKSKAVLTDDGKSYILNGTKQFITNAGFADIFTVFAKVDGDKFSAFLVEKGTPGFSIGPEEKKMGIKGSSTCALIFEDCKIPAENLLGEIGKGHKIAFNILNVGRFKLGATALGYAKYCLNESVKYANERVQFKVPISNFGMIKRKIADMAAYIYSTESMVYRVAGLMDEKMADLDKSAADYALQQMMAIEEFAIEDSIIKAYGTECLDFCADEGLQILGGYGFTQEYPLERAYRDSRINRLYEGTNEINRLVITTTLLKRAQKGQLAWMDAAKKIEKEAESGELDIKAEGPLAWDIEATEKAKKALVFTSNAAIMKYMKELMANQEIIEMVAEMVMESFGMDSSVSRTLQLIEEVGEEKAKYAIATCNVVCQLAADKILTIATQLLSSCFEGDEYKKLAKGLHNFRLSERVNLIEKRRIVADRIIDREAYELV